jgi:hypothetical protein
MVVVCTALGTTHHHGAAHGTDSHEHNTRGATAQVGHNLGLYHDGTPTATYYAGHGSGASSWAPIMVSPHTQATQLTTHSSPCIMHRACWLPHAAAQPHTICMGTSKHVLASRRHARHGITSADWPQGQLLNFTCLYTKCYLYHSYTFLYQLAGRSLQQRGLTVEQGGLHQVSTIGTYLRLAFFVVR